MRTDDLKSLVRVLTGKQEPAPEYSNFDVVADTLAGIKADGGWDHLLHIVRFRAFRLDMVFERERQGLSIAELAERADLPESTIRAFEQDFLPDPTMSTLARIAHALDLQIQVSVSERRGDLP